MLFRFMVAHGISHEYKQADREGTDFTQSFECFVAPACKSATYSKEVPSLFGRTDRKGLMVLGKYSS